MDKRREVLEKLAYGGKGMYNEISKEQINQALTALNKLEKEKMLKMVGKDKEIAISVPAYLNAIQNEKISYNKAKAEIRRKVRGL